MPYRISDIYIYIIYNYIYHIGTKIIINLDFNHHIISSYIINISSRCVNTLIKENIKHLNKIHLSIYWFSGISDAEKSHGAPLLSLHESKTNSIALVIPSSKLVTCFI